MTDTITNFFAQYERADATSNLAPFAELYAERFLFAGPGGTHFVERDAFLRILPGIKAHLSSMGLKEKQMHSLEYSSMDSKYILAKVGWRMEVESASVKRHIEASATFVLMSGEQHTLSIVAQIDHQDLAAMLSSASPPS